MTTVSVVLDCVICSKTDPLGKWAVLLHRLSELDLGAECLLGWLYFVERRSKEEEWLELFIHIAIDK